MANLNAKITLDNKAFIDGLREVNYGWTASTDNLRNQTGAMGGAKAAAKALAGSYLALKAARFALDQVGKGVQLAGHLETEKVRLEVLLGSMQEAESLMNRVMSKASETPLSTQELQGATRMLIAFGSNSETVVDELTRLGDLSQGVGMGIGELAQLYGKARTQGTLFAEDINQLTARGIPVTQEFAKILGVSVGEVKALASEGKIGFKELEQAIINMTGEGGRFNGMMEKMSQTWEGKVSTLKDNFNAMILIPVGEWAKGWATDMVDGLSASLELMQEFRGYGAEGMKAANASELDGFRQKSSGISSLDEFDAEQAKIMTALKQAKVMKKALESNPNPSKSDEWRKVYIEEHIRNLRQVLVENGRITDAEMRQRAEIKAKVAEEERLLELKKLEPARAAAQAAIDEDAKNRADRDAFKTALADGDKGPIQEQLAAAKTELEKLKAEFDSMTDVQAIAKLEPRVKAARDEVERLQGGLDQIDVMDEKHRKEQQKVQAEYDKAELDAKREKLAKLDADVGGMRLNVPEMGGSRARSGLSLGGPNVENLARRQLDEMGKMRRELEEIRKKIEPDSDPGGWR